MSLTTIVNKTEMDTQYSQKLKNEEKDMEKLMSIVTKINNKTSHKQIKQIKSKYLIFQI